MEDKVKFECDVCGCYFWVENRNNFNCPNCEEIKNNQNGGKNENI